MKNNPFHLGKMVFIIGVSAIPLVGATTYAADSTKQVVQVVDDQTLDTRIHDKIDAGLLTNGYPDVTVDVKNGKVLLQGFVNTQKDKDKLEKELRDIEGVKAFDSKVQVKEPSSTDRQAQKFAQDTFTTSADDQLNKKIRDHVSKGILWDSYTEVILNTANGNVVLMGVVKNANDQDKLVTEIQKVEGVKSVKSELKFKNP